MSSLAQAEKEAREAVDKWSAGAIAVGWIPMSSVLLGAGDIGMVIHVAYIFGIEITEKQAEVAWATILAPFVAGRVGHILADIGLSLIPGWGWAAKAGVAGGVTKAIGEGVIQYFKIRSPYV
jgi:uncharacterized protein (DUF697 family)